MMSPNFVILGVIIQSVGGVGYLLDTIKGRVQPNKVSWLLWAIAPLVAFAAELSQGVGIQALTTFFVGFIPLVVLIASLEIHLAEKTGYFISFGIGNPSLTQTFLFFPNLAI